MTHAQSGEHGVGKGERFLGRNTLMSQRLSNVVPCVEVREQIAFLEDERDRLLSEFNQFLAREPSHVLSTQTDGPGAGLHQPSKALHEGGFSGARGSDHGDGFPGLHVDVKASKSNDVAVFGFGFVDVVEAVGLQNGLGHLHSPFSTLAKSALRARRAVTNNATTTAPNTAKDTRMICVHG